MRKLKNKALIIAMGSLLLVGCASTPMKELKPSEMIVGKNSKYSQMNSPEGLSAWERGIWEYKHKNYKEALTLLEPHKDKDISIIQHAYGVMYQAGRGGLKIDFSKAVKRYRRAIKINNHPASLYNLSYLYRDGKGVGEDRSKYQELLLLSAKGGYIAAQFNLASSYHWGREGFSEDFGMAYYWYQQASNQGMPMAARRIGWMYDHDEGFEHNDEKAFYWHKLAAKRGNEHSKGDMIRLKSILYKRNKK